MLTSEDESWLAVQTGRTLRGVVAVAARCPVGHPAVITCYPLWRRGRRVTPFPTLYWLTCPRLAESVSHLERDGAVASAQAALDNDQDRRSALLRDHQDYIARRWDVLSHDDRLLVAQMGLLEHFQSRGIGGMTNRAAVKCLHLHLAHHLASSNTLGAWLVNRYGVRPCSSA